MPALLETAVSLPVRERSSTEAASNASVAGFHDEAAQPISMYHPWKP